MWLHVFLAKKGVICKKTFVKNNEECHVGRKWCTTFMVNLDKNVWGGSSYVTRIGWNCSMISWMTTKRCAKDNHLSDLIYIGHVLGIYLVDQKMHGVREIGDR
jgi:hypothetical protein